jgi:prevent-host-death family protein
MDTTTIDIHEAQVHLLELLALVNAGNEVTVTQAQKPVMRLVPAGNGEKRRIAGLHAGMGWISDDFDAPLSDEFWAGAQ